MKTQQCCSISYQFAQALQVSHSGMFPLFVTRPLPTLVHTGFALVVPQEVGGCTHELISAGCKSPDIFLEYWTLDLFPCLHTYLLVHQRMLRQLMLNIGAFSSVHVCGCYLSYPLAPSETPWHGFYSVLLNRRYNHYKWVVVKTRGGWNIGSPIIMRCSL